MNIPTSLFTVIVVIITLLVVAVVALAIYANQLDAALNVCQLGVDVRP